MNLVITTINSDGKNNVEINIRELILRLQSLAKECSIEVTQLAIASMLDEIKDAAKQ